jgi:hypothetical protein
VIECLGPPQRVPASKSGDIEQHAASDNAVCADRLDARLAHAAVGAIRAIAVPDLSPYHMWPSASQCVLACAKPVT